MLKYLYPDLNDKTMAYGHSGKNMDYLDISRYSKYYYVKLIEVRSTRKCKLSIEKRF